VVENSISAHRARSTGIPAEQDPPSPCLALNLEEGTTTMKALSEQLSDLSVRAKQTEDAIEATREKNRETREKNRAKLDARRDELKKSIAAERTKAKKRASARVDTAHAQWNDARNSVEQRFAKLKSNAEERHAERNAKHAEKHAERAEEDAADAVEFALYVLDEAEYALIDAAIARSEADELALSS
jgi:phage shock protein A